jgi:hypothetical protein
MPLSFLLRLSFRKNFYLSSIKDSELLLLYPCLTFLFYLQNESSSQYTGDGSVDFNGKPVLKQNTGNWRACPFILGDLLFLTLL